jgi:ABC-type glutathione transport system ATPase component
LEDTKKRLQERINKISPAYDLNVPTNIYFVTKANKLGAGLSEQITEFLDAHPQTNLIVIDTLQYIRNTGKFTGTYSGDYHDMDALRRIVSNRNLTMLLITHNHKTSESDPVNRVIGSAGLTGAVDGILILEKNKRIGSAAKLTIANRDTESHQFELRFDNSSCHWLFIRETSTEENAEYYLYELLNLLLDETPIWSGTATQLRAALTVLDPSWSISPISLSRMLKSQREYLREHYAIEVRFTRSKTARFIELSRNVINVDCEIVRGESLALVG